MHSRLSREWLGTGLRLMLPLTLLIAGGCAETTDELIFVADAEPVEQLQVVAKDATVELSGRDFEDEIRVIATRRFSIQAPKVSVATVDGQLRVSHRCRGQRVCEVHYVILMPREIDAQVVSDGGSVLATDMTGDLELHTVWGDVYGGALQSSDVTVTTELGQVTLFFETPPDRVRVDALEGDATVSVPRDESYALDLQSDRGDVTITNLSSEPDAERSIVVTSDGGDITVRGTTPLAEPPDSDEDEDQGDDADSAEDEEGG